MPGDARTAAALLAFACPQLAAQQAFLLGLGFLGADTSSEALAVSADGAVAAGTSQSDVAVLWTRVGGMRRLDAVLAGQGANIPGWRLREATGVSADGRVVVGLGTNPQGRIEAFAAGLLWPWTELGRALTGVDGPPRANGDGTLLTGARTEVLLDHARPPSVAALVVGFAPAWAPLWGGTLVPRPDAVVWPLLIDARGELAVTFAWPALPAGTRALVAALGARCRGAVRGGRVQRTGRRSAAV